MKQAAGGRASSAPVMGGGAEPTIFELSFPGRKCAQLPATGVADMVPEDWLPADLLASGLPALPEVSERDLVAHYTRLSERQYSVDTGAYPLGSCTMKYNPKGFDQLAGMPALASASPHLPVSRSRGWMRLLLELEWSLCGIAGMDAFTLQPPAGAAGELVGLLIVNAYHRSTGDLDRKVVIVPDSAHGTNPASAKVAGLAARTVRSTDRGLVDVDALEAELDSTVAAIMLTNPNTLGLFEEDVERICRMAHDAGALAYYDGANLNAIVGLSRPGDMGFDVMHVNLHKTFATPHGGGGPGAGPVGVKDFLAQFLPGPIPRPAGGVKAEGVIGTEGSVGNLGWGGSEDIAAAGTAEGTGRARDEVGAAPLEWWWPEQSIGRAHSFHGNALVLARALAYILVHGSPGLRRVAETAVLNANWLLRAIEGAYDAPYGRPCMHECVVSVANLKKAAGVRATDVGKLLLDRGFHAPTISFPLVVDEALMLEPTETESPQTLAALATTLVEIAGDAQCHGSGISADSPQRTPVGRVDEATAARRPILTEDDREG